MHDKILILDFGSQYTQLIARKIRELNVYCEIYPFNHYPEPDSSVRGVVLSGSPFSVRDKNSPQPDIIKITDRFPVLGICYGAQLMAHQNGGLVQASKTREYGRANLQIIEKSNQLLKNLSSGTQVWMSHGDTITNLPDNYRVIGSTDDVMVGSFHLNYSDIYRIKFNP